MKVVALRVPLPTLAVTVRLSEPVPVTLMLAPGLPTVFSPTVTGLSGEASLVTVGATRRSA